MNKQQLADKYPYHKVKYPPQENCAACKGTGEHLNGFGETTLCVCCCVNLDGIGGMFKEFISSLKASDE